MSSITVNPDYLKPEVVAWLRDLQRIGHLDVYLESLYECNALEWYEAKLEQRKGGMYEGDISIKRLETGLANAIKYNRKD